MAVDVRRPFIVILTLTLTPHQRPGGMCNSKRIPFRVRAVAIMVGLFVTGRALFNFVTWIILLFMAASKISAFTDSAE